MSFLNTVGVGGGGGGGGGLSFLARFVAAGVELGKK